MTDHHLIRRQRAAEAVRDAFIDVPHAWGSYDCGKMVAAHLRHFGIAAGVSKAGSYRTMIGAQRALKRLGVSSLAERLDQLGLMRIAPAYALIGDIIELPSTGPLDAMSIVLGNGRVLGYHELALGATILQPVTMLAAWRVPA